MASPATLPLPPGGRLYYYNLMMDKGKRASWFNDPDLRRAEPCLDGNGDPEFYSGGLAIVYKAKIGGKYCALRFFCAHYTDTLRDRLGMISDFIKKSKPSFLVNFSFMPEGILEKGNSGARPVAYPVVKMDWVEGETLYNYIDANVRKRNKMADLAAKWSELCRTLTASGASHGDLHPENVIVGQDGNLKLVDYDGMYVPAFSKLNLLPMFCGIADFQHPNRSNSRYFGTRNDNFSALLIYASILALCYAPDLWKGAGYNRIIADLASVDFQGQNSAVLNRLEGLNPEIAACVSELKRASMRPLEDTKPLYQVVKSGARVSNAQPAGARLRGFAKKKLLETDCALLQRLCAIEVLNIRSAKANWRFVKEKFLKINRMLLQGFCDMKRGFAGVEIGRKLARFTRRWRNKYPLRRAKPLIGIGASLCLIAVGWNALARDEERYKRVFVAPKKTVAAKDAFEKRQPEFVAHKPESAATDTLTKKEAPSSFPSESEKPMYVNTGIRRDRTQGRGCYEREFDNRYGKGQFKVYLGEDYKNYESGEEMPIIIGGDKKAAEVQSAKQKDTEKDKNKPSPSLKMPKN